MFLKQNLKKVRKVSNDNDINNNKNNNKNNNNNTDKNNNYKK